MNKKAKQVGFELVLASLKEKDMDCTVTYVDGTHLHDRYFLGSNGVGYHVGASFRSGKPTVASKLDAAIAEELYRRHVEFLELESSVQLEARKPVAASASSAAESK